MGFGYREVAFWAIVVEHLGGFDGKGAIVIKVPVHEFLLS
jgi:hypothetical protein